MDDSRVPLNQSILKAAFARWGVAGALSRIWQTWRTGGVTAVRYKLRSFYRQFVAPQGQPDMANSPHAWSHASEPSPASSPRPKTARVAPKLQRGDLLLSEDRSTDPRSWSGWLSPLIAQHLIRPLGSSTPAQARQRIWVAMDQRGANSDPVRLRWSLDAAAAFKAAFEGEVAFAMINTERPNQQSLSALTVALLKTAPSLPHTGSAATVAQSDPLCLDAFLDLVADEDLVLFLRNGDRVRPEMAAALSAFDLFAAEIATVDLYFGDEGRIYPLLLAGANPLMGMNCDHFRSRFLAQGRAVREALAAVRDGGNTPPTPYTLAAALFEEAWYGSGRGYVHVPIPLIEIDESRDTLREDMRRNVRTASCIALGGKRAAALSNCAPKGDVSIIICTKDKGHLVRQLVRNTLQTKSEWIRDIVIISNQTTNAFARSTLEDLNRESRVKIIDYPEPFNFSRQNNLGAKFAGGKHLLFLNDDIAPVSDTWLEQLLAPFAHPDVGAVGPLLVYPDERVQHAGMFLGYAGVAGHTLRFARLPDDDYNFLSISPREVHVLTGAALMTRRDLFEDINGFDPLLATYIQDVDLCLRLRGLGKKLVYNPCSILVHMESLSIAEMLGDQIFSEQRSAEHAHFLRRWGKDLDKDPFHNPNLCRQNEALRVLRAPRSQQ
ncbi:MAG: glycosyltransferase [Caulobacterales bacterium]